MGAPDSGIQAGEQPEAEELLSALKTISAAERRKHAGVLGYWLSIRGEKEFPPLHDFDPLQVSEVGQSSVLLELIGGGHDAEVRHLGDALKGADVIERIIDAPATSVLSNIAKKLPIVAISRDFLAFEDDVGADSGVRCWVTLLPLSSSGAWVDYVYACVTVDAAPAEIAPEPSLGEDSEVVESSPPAGEVIEDAVVTSEITGQAEEPVDPQPALEPEELEESPAGKSGPGFAKLLEGFANLTGFYGQGVQAPPLVQPDSPDTDAPLGDPAADEVSADEVSGPSGDDSIDPAPEPESVETPTELETVVTAAEPEQPAAVVEPVAADVPEVESSTEGPEEPSEPSPAPTLEGSLQNKLDEVQAKADEARQAQLRATEALHEGLSAAYDFALDAENSPEEYLRLVETQGLKIQLRAPMAPVAKLAFDGVCDAATIRQFEAVLAWALKVELPRGALLERIQQAGGIPELLDEFAKAA